MPATRGRAVAWSKVEGLYSIPQGAMTWSEPSMSFFLPLPKRHRLGPTVTVSSPKVQSNCHGPVSPGAQGRCIRAWGPSLSVPLPKETNIPAKMTPLHVNIGDTKRVYHCQVEGCAEGPLSYHATICAHVQHTHLGMKLPCPFCPIIVLHTNAIKCHYKQAHCSRFLWPT